MYKLMLLAVTVLFIVASCSNSNTKSEEEKKNYSEDEIEELIDTVEGSDYVDEKVEAIEKLGKAGDERAVDVLVKSLDDKYIRYKAALALGKIGSEKAVPPLIKATESNDKYFRYTGMIALANIKSSTAKNAFISGLKDDFRYVKLAAIYGIDVSEIDTALVQLVDTSKSEDREIKKYSLYAIERILQRSNIDTILKYLNSSNKPKLRIILIDFLGRYKEEKAVPHIVKILTEKRTNTKVKLSCITALGNIRSTKAIKPLIKTFRNTTNPKVKRISRMVLKSLGVSRRLLSQ